MPQAVVCLVEARANKMADPWELLEAWAKENVHATAFGEEATARQLAKRHRKGLEFLRPQLPKLPEAIFPIFSSPN